MHFIPSTGKNWCTVTVVPRIQRYIADRIGEMAFIHDNRAKAALPQMPCYPYPRVDISGIAPVRIGEGRAQSVFMAGHNDDMNMVGHQTIAPDLRARLFSRLAQQIFVERIVFIIEECWQATVASLGHMMGKDGDNNAGKTSHGRKL